MQEMQEMQEMQVRRVDMVDIEPSGGPDDSDKRTPSVGLEEALELTGYGKFNYKLLGGVCLGMATQNMVTTDMAYTLPAAECDLNLTAMQKGWINAIMFLGMMATAFVWGALSDSLGRKWLLLTAFFSLATVGVVTSMVTSAWVLLICRFLTGMLMIGPASLLLTYAGELFGKHHRARMFMWAGTMQAMSAATQAAVAMWIIPMQLQWLRSWRLFLLITASISTFSGLYMLLLPESPKYLAARGRQRESIIVLQSIFASNTGLPRETYPVKSLALSKHMQSEPGNPFTSMARQFAKLVRKPYRNCLLFVVVMQPLLLFCLNTIRMWVPQIFAQMQRDAAANITARNVCSILEDSNPMRGNSSQTATPVDCDSFSIDASVYLNSIIIMASRAAAQLLASIVIRPLGQKVVIVSALLMGSGVLVAWPFAASANVVLILASLFEGLGHTAFSTLLLVIVDLFPTGVRSSAYGLSNFSGRSGSMVGNLAFPLLFTTSCSSAFWIAATLFSLAALIAVFQPKPSFTPTPSIGLAAKQSVDKGVDNAGFGKSQDINVK